MIYVLDLDGTVIDSSARHGALLKSILDSKNISYPDDFEIDYLKYKRNGNSTFNYLTEVLKCDYTISKKISKEWVEHIEDWEWIVMDELYKDSIPFLNLISNNGVVYFLSSRKSKRILKQELECLEIIKYANRVYVVCPSEGYEGKTRIIKELLKKHNDGILLFGDTEIDYKTAINTGIKKYILNRGFRSKEYWDMQGIKSYSSLPKGFIIDNE